MTTIMTTADKLKVTQDNQLIEACYSMTLNEKRLLLLGISKINPMVFPDKSKPFKFEITAAEWAEHFGNNNSWRSLKRSATKLLSRHLTLHPKTGVVKKINWFESVDYHDAGKDGYAHVFIEFGRNVQIRLAGMLEQFTTIDLLAVSELNSSHAVRLYELIMQFKSTGYRKITVEDFRLAMDVVNTNKGTKELKRAVLNPAVKQVNEKSDLFCIVTDIKKGVRITGFKFTFRTQEQQKLF
jgi:plasmid replication initiation protein